MKVMVGVDYDLTPQSKEAVKLALKLVKDLPQHHLVVLCVVPSFTFFSGEVLMGAYGVS